MEAKFLNIFQNSSTKAKFPIEFLQEKRILGIISYLFHESRIPNIISQIFHES